MVLGAFFQPVRTMKRSLIFALALGLLAQCRNSEPVPGDGTAKLGQTFVAWPRQTVVVTDLNTAYDPEPVLKLRLLSLEHTPCPPNAYCCFPSYVTAKFTMEFMGQTSTVIETTFPRCEQAAKFTTKAAVGGRTFEVSMDAVRPQINLKSSSRQQFEAATFTVR